MKYRIIRSDRRTVSIRITPAGEVIVRCPRGMRAADVDTFVRARESWIEDHLKKCTPSLPPLTEAELADLMKQARGIIPERVAHFASLAGVTYGRVTIRSQRTRWGSCSAKGNLNFNCLLMLVPPEVADYVVVHELCHRKELNHSARFWAQVERIMPDYRARRKWLKDNGNALIGRLPA